MVCQGCILSGGHVRRSILSPNVRVNSFAVVEDSILFEGVDVGRHSHVRRAIIDKDVKIPPNSTIGYDLEHDRQRGFAVTEQGEHGYRIVAGWPGVPFAKYLDQGTSKMSARSPS